MAGWIDANPAVPVRPPRIRISRQRLSVDYAFQAEDDQGLIDSANAIVYWQKLRRHDDQNGVRAADSRIVWQTPLARELLQSYFGEVGPDGAPTPFGQWAPEPVQAWLRRHVLADNAAELLEASLAEPPRLAVEQGARRLTFRLHQQAGDSAGGGDWLIVMREVSDAKIIESMSLSFKLTAREAEVLYWVVKGKINRDIGDILGASPATVKKHLERVFAKLGVETRTAAAAMAMNRIRQLHPQFEG